MYHSTLRATFTFLVDKSWLKMAKMVHFVEFLKTWSLRSNSVTRQVSFNRTKIGGKCQNQKINMRHYEWFLNHVRFIIIAHWTKWTILVDLATDFGSVYNGDIVNSYYHLIRVKTGWVLEHEVVANAHVLWYAAGNPNLRADCHFHLIYSGIGK